MRNTAGTIYGKERDVTAIISYTWDYFDFHAKQRTQMFNFFIICAGILGNAVGLLLRTDNHSDLAAIPLYAGAILSLSFLSLDIRNTQLLQMAEDVLDAIERRNLFRGHPPFVNRDGVTVTLGLISRENIFEEKLRNKRKCTPDPSARIIDYIINNRTKHKMSIRVVESLSFIMFLFLGNYSMYTGAINHMSEFYRIVMLLFLSFVLVVVWISILTHALRGTGT